jgi:hypothetical protein
MSTDPIPGLAAMLRDGRDYIFESVHGLTEEQARQSPAPGRWSALDCLEHLTLVEGRFQEWLLNGREIEPNKSVEREMTLYQLVTDRSEKREAPEAVLPAGRFASLAAATAAFTHAREKTMQLAAERGTGLYTINASHPRFGDMNGAELMNLIAGHARRHADQIREVRKALSL